MFKKNTILAIETEKELRKKEKMFKKKKYHPQQ